MSKPYRPSNGSEGEMFERQFCDRCEHQGPCMIAANAFWHNIDDPLYPSEWIVDDDGLSNPRCTVFAEN